MKYYAVTEDPNELFHYGRLGMKWGKHIFGDKPKSPGYKRALGKLRASTKSVKNAVQKSATQHSINRQKRQQNKYNQAVKKAQRNNELIENLYNLDKVRVNERGLDRDYWGAAKIARIQDKQQRKIDRINNKRAIKQLKTEVRNSRNELKMDKIAKKARQGKLKYGQLSDEQVQRLTNRLAMEQNARKLGSAEKTWRQQKKEAFRQGKLQGITKGTAAAMEEVARAGTIYGISKFMNRKKLKAAAKQEGKEERIKNRERNKKTHRDIKKEFKNEVYETRVREGEILGAVSAADRLKEIKRLSDQKAWELDQERKTLDSQRQDRLAEARADRQRELIGKMAYEQGYLPFGSLVNNSNQNNQNQGKKNKQNKQQGLAGLSRDPDEVKAWRDWYEQVYIKGETIQQREARAKKDAEKARKQEQKVVAAERRREKLDKAYTTVENKVRNTASLVMNTLDDKESTEAWRERARAVQQIKDQQKAAREAQKAVQRIVVNDQRNPNKNRRPETQYRPDQDDYVPMYTNDPPRNGKVKSGPWGVYDAVERDKRKNRGGRR